MAGQMQDYSYDAVNRLVGVVESDNNNVQTLQRSFSYDPYGNMWITQNSGVPLAGNAPTTNNYNPATNQRGDQAYDAAGNQISVNGETMSYDAENRQIQAQEPQSQGGATETYSYDGLGQRVRRGKIFVYAHDAFGRLMEEYFGLSGRSQAEPDFVFARHPIYDYIWFQGQVVAVESPSRGDTCTTCYLTSDSLGSIRMVTDENANVASRHDYMPFGDEIPVGSAERTSDLGYGGDDPVEQRFTGQIRDSETSMDYFNARYFGSALGRFTSPRSDECGRGSE